MDSSLEKAANEFLFEKLQWKDSMKDDSFNPTLDVKLDLNELTRIKNEHTDLPTARILENNSNRYTYRRHPHQIYKLMTEVSKIMGGFAVPTGLYYYPPGGACGWHTNSNNPGERYYLVWTKESGKSFFRYYDNEKDEIVTQYDKKGWALKKFKVCDKNLLWHCVGSDTTRISIGFKLNNNHVLNGKLNLYDDYFSGKEMVKNECFINNFIIGAHSTLGKSDRCDWSVKHDMMGRLPLILIDDIILEQPPTEIPIDLISWKSKDTPEFKNYKCVNTDNYLPIVVVPTKLNPHDCLFRAIDGSHRLCKLREEGADTVKCFILDEGRFLKTIINTPLNIPEPVILKKHITKQHLENIIDTKSKTRGKVIKHLIKTTPLSNANRFKYSITKLSNDNVYMYSKESLTYGILLINLEEKPLTFYFIHMGCSFTIEKGEILMFPLSCEPYGYTKLYEHTVDRKCKVFKLVSYVNV